MQARSCIGEPVAEGFASASRRDGKEKVDGATPDALSQVVDECRSGRTSFVVSGAPLTELEPDAKQAVLFVKPELLEPAVDFKAIWQAVAGTVRELDGRIGAYSGLGPAHLSHVISAHYGVINRISTQGASALSSGGRQALAGLAHDMPGDRILGGHQLLSLTGLPASELMELVREAGSQKLAPGSYLSVVEAAGERYGVLNGFHPAQLEQYTREGAAVLAVELIWSGRSWESFRTEAIGATDPQRAVAGSLRQQLLARRHELGVQDITVNRNGVHGSAGPIEAAVELSRFFAVPISATAIGRRLGVTAWNTGAVSLRLAEDPPVETTGQTLFEETEASEPEAAVRVARDVLSDLLPNESRAEDR